MGYVYDRASYKPRRVSYGQRIAIALDQLLNALFAGSEDETISSRAYKASLGGKRWGCLLCRFLNWLDKDHCKNSVEWDEGGT